MVRSLNRRFVCCCYVQASKPDFILLIFCCWSWAVAIAHQDVCCWCRIRKMHHFLCARRIIPTKGAPDAECLDAANGRAFMKWAEVLSLLCYIHWQRKRWESVYLYENVIDVIILTLCLFKRCKLSCHRTEEQAASSVLVCCSFFFFFQWSQRGCWAYQSVLLSPTVYVFSKDCKLTQT